VLEVFEFAEEVSEVFEVLGFLNAMASIGHS
jgi:hypothetical protein